MMELGLILMSRGISNEVADSSLFAKEVMSCIERYASCDWGDVSEDDKMLNDEAIETGDRILAAYETLKGRIWILTEADRSATTILFPDEY